MSTESTDEIDGRFWGPKMSEILRWCDSQEIKWRTMPIPKFTEMMDKRLGCKHTYGDSSERIAEMWLEAIKSEGYYDDEDAYGVMPE